MIKAIFCDLDGTLLGKDLRLSEENSEAINALAARGIELIPTTGRDLFEIPESVREHGSVRRFICSNGAGYYNLTSGESRHMSIPRESAVQILRSASEMSLIPVIHSMDGRAYFDRSKHSLEVMRDHCLSEYFCKFFMENAYCVDDIYGRFSDGVGINSLCFFFKYGEELERTAALLDKRGVGYTHSTEGELEIFNAAAGKGNAVLDTAGRLGLGPDEILVVGDSSNDLSMFSVTENSLAVANASPRLKESARYVGCDNGEHIAKYILENLV